MEWAYVLARILARVLDRPEPLRHTVLVAGCTGYERGNTMNTTTTTTIPSAIGRIMRKGSYPMSAIVAEGNRAHADMALATLERYGYTSSSAVSVEQYPLDDNGIARVVSVCGHDNGANVVLVHPLSVVPAMTVDRVTGLCQPWGYVWEEDLV